MIKQIDKVLKEMEMVYLNDDRPWIIGYSGGKDSTVVVQLVYEMLKRLPKHKLHKKVYIVSSDTLIENPIILDHLNETCELIQKSSFKDELPLEVNIVHPEYDDSFWTNVIGRGYPTPKSATFRWCTSRLKIDPSNKFIENKVKENKEVIVLLGVRKDESESRKESIEKREIEGYILNPHHTLNNAYVYSPIADLRTDEVWSILLKNNGINPWGGSNELLFELYKDGDGGECPFIMIETDEKNNIKTPSCGRTRFGCWICTVVNDDKSLLGFVETGNYDWLIPLVEFREWILEIRENRKYRAKKQRTGRIYRLKKDLSNLTNEEIDEFIEEGYEIKIDSDGERYFWIKGLGPFNYEGRKLILRKLLQTQNKIGIELIKEQELKEIERIWNREFDVTKTELTKIYYEETGKYLDWAKYNKPIFSESTIKEINNAIKKYDINEELYSRLIILADDNKLYNNKTKFRKEMNKLLNQQWLHKEIYDDEEYLDEN